MTHIPYVKGTNSARWMVLGDTIGRQGGYDGARSDEFEEGYEAGWTDGWAFTVEQADAAPDDRRADGDRAAAAGSGVR